MLEPMIRSTREEAEASMVRAMLLGESPQESVTPHTGSHAAGDREGRMEHRATGHLTEQRHRRT